MLMKQQLEKEAIALFENNHIDCIILILPDMTAIFELIHNAKRNERPL
jgi:hypothetical protein